MKQIKKYLEDNNINYEIKSIWNKENIVITLEKDNTWINSYNEEMKWNRDLRIHQNQYNKYILTEITGYSKERTHLQSGKQKDIISKLETILTAK